MSQAYHPSRGRPSRGRTRARRARTERIEALANHPDLGRVVPEFEQSFLRELIHAPFRIVYRRDPDLIRIVRVWRGERRSGLSGLSTWRKPLPNAARLR